MFFPDIPYLRVMKVLIIRLMSITMAFIFMSHVTGIRISEHTCFECQTKHIEIGGHLHSLHLIVLLTKELSHCCDPFHHQHENHSKECSHKFLAYDVPFQIMDSSKVHQLNPFSFVTQEIHSVMGSSRIVSPIPTTLETPVLSNIRLKTCQFLT